MPSCSFAVPRSPAALALAAALLALASVLAPARAAAAAPVITYVALGDSTAAGVGGGPGGGYPARLARRIEASGLPVKLLNLGVAGATVADLRRDQLPRAQGAGATVITLAIGINDLTKERTLRDFARDLEVVADLVQRTKAQVLMSNLPDLTLAPSTRGAPPSFGRRIAQFNAAIQTTAERHGFTVVDAYAASRAAVRAHGAERVFADDGFHPSAVGYDAWAEAFWPGTERALAPRAQARRPAAVER